MLNLTLLVKPISVLLTALIGASAFSIGFATLATSSTPVHLQQPRAITSVEREWIAAREAFDRRDIAALTQAREQFNARNDFVLKPYVEFWLLTARLGQDNQNARAFGEQIERFIDANRNAPYTEQLQRDYLRALAKLELWKQFQSNQARYLGDDSDVACQRLRNRLINDDLNAQPLVLAEAKAIWIAARPVAESCYGVFSRLVTSAGASRIGSNDIWQRVRVLFENGQLNDARRSAVLITNLPSSFESASAAAHLDPPRFLAKHIIKSDDRASVELALLALSRYARTKPEDAASWLDKNATKFAIADAQYGWAQIGYYGSMQQERDALKWYQRAGSFDLTDIQAAWLVRAALRETVVDVSQWQRVKKAIRMMSAEEQKEASWRYWLARALVQTKEANDAVEARTLRETLAKENNFYGVLASEEISTGATPIFQGYQPTDAEIASAATRGGVVRALLLYRLADAKPELRNEALREWQFAVRNMDDQTLLATAEVARRNGLPDRAINTAERTKSLHDFSQRFPLPHREALQASAKSNNLDEAWIYGLIRQESRFITDARSRVGAKGLMQLMPPTAKWVAKQAGIKDFVWENVADVQTNLALGSFYLRHVLDDLGHPVLATAGYNAGPGRARRWRADSPLEGAIYAESIPFSETRDYVKKVMVNKWFYGFRIHGKSPTLSSIMGIVPAKRASSSAANAATQQSNFTIVTSSK
jgi:soluble lytic murein transglycosylase